MSLVSRLFVSPLPSPPPHLDLLHGRVLPQAQLVFRVPVAAKNLPLVPAPLQRADLTPRVNAVEQRPGRGGPELYAPVGGSAARGEEVAVVGGPGEGLDGGLVVRESVPSLGGWGVGHTLPFGVLVGWGGVCWFFELVKAQTSGLNESGECPERQCENMTV